MPPLVPEGNNPRRGMVWKGKTVLSGIDPEGRADKTADAVQIKDRTLYFCPSPLYGYGLKRLLARLGEEAPNSAILCVEADPRLHELFPAGFGALAETQQRLHITTIRDAAGLCALVRRRWGGRVFRRLETLRFTGGWQLFPELYDSLAEALRREIATDWGNALTLTRLGRRYFRNALANLALVPRCPSVGELSFGSAPVLVLGAGPSLDGILEGLFRRFGKSLAQSETRRFAIVCVDTCLPALRERGISPDLAVILESQHWNLRDFRGCLGWQVPAAMDLSALPASGRVLGGPLYLFVTPWTELRIFTRLAAAGLLPGAVPPLGSVGLCAAELSRRLSGGTIITAGIDFSFSLDASHARSTPGHRDRLNSQNRFRGILDPAAAFGPAAFGAVSKSGLPVRSNPAMRNYRDLFEREFAAGPRLFDIAGSGLPLGLRTLSPEAAFDALAAETGAAGEANPESGGGGQADRRQEAAGEAPDATKGKAEKLKSFLEAENSRLLALREMLTGARAASALEALVDECDYLWAHFPDYAGASGRRPDTGEIAAGSAAAVSFLKRLRAEIDPALSLLERTLAEAQGLSAK